MGMQCLCPFAFVCLHSHRHMQAEVVRTTFDVLKPRSLRLARSGDTALVVIIAKIIGRMGFWVFILFPTSRFIVRR